LGAPGNRRRNAKGGAEMKGNIRDFRGEVDAKRQHIVDSAIEGYKIQLEKAERRYNDLRADFDAFVEECEVVAYLDQEFSKPRPLIQRTKTGTKESCMIGIMSDWHVFETVLPREVNGLNEYNQVIARNSAEEFFQTLLVWTEIHRGRAKIDDLVLACLGDIITNMLHPDQQEGNSGTPQEEIIFALQLICSGLDMLIDAGGFKTITVCCCDGNHGRDTDRIRASGRCRHSHEWLLYNFLARLYEPRGIKFVIAESYHLYQQVYGHTFRLHHGDGIRYQGGVGGLTIPMNKAIAAWNKAKSADYDVFGHWHQTINPSRFLSVGTLLGYSPFAIKIKADFEPPQQSCMTVSPERLVTSVNRIYVR